LLSFCDESPQIAKQVLPKLKPNLWNSKIFLWITKNIGHFVSKFGHLGNKIMFFGGETLRIENKDMYWRLQEKRFSQKKKCLL